MKRKAFRELLISVREAGCIRRGTTKPARMTDIRGTDVNVAHGQRVPRNYPKKNTT
jgi:hypothetical protein